MHCKHMTILRNLEPLHYRSLLGVLDAREGRGIRRELGTGQERERDWRGVEGVGGGWRGVQGGTDDTCSASEP